VNDDNDKLKARAFFEKLILVVSRLFCLHRHLFFGTMCRIAMVKKFLWKVADLAAPMRLDLFCAEQLLYLTRSQVKSGLVFVAVNGIETKLSKKVYNGDAVEFHYQPAKPDTLELFPYRLSIAYEDKNIIVVKKPSGMVTHPAGGHYTKTLVNALEWYRRKGSNLQDEFSLTPLDFTEANMRRGIIHRLDKDTSGLIITVRNKAAEKFFIDAFKTHRIAKYYIAILDKPLKNNAGLLKTGIVRSKQNRQKFIAVGDCTKGKIAVTRYKVLRRFQNFSLVLFRIYTGRTHQIRVHAKYLHSGIVGDVLYNRDKKNALMLHAISLSFETQDGKLLHLKTKMPRRFAEFYKKHAAEIKNSATRQ
jgi:ribosomal large subunit pseudouridine synthase D